MSAPQTNIEKQQRRHRGPLIGMVVVVIAVGIGFIWWLGYEATESDPVQGSQTQIDGRTGEETTPDPDPSATGTETVTPPVERSEQSSPGVPAQNVDPLTPADVPAVDPVEPTTTTPPAN